MKTFEIYNNTISWKDKNVIRKFRKRRQIEEPKVLFCKRCNGTLTSTNKMENDLNKEYVDINNLIWQGLWSSDFICGIDANFPIYDDDVLDATREDFQALLTFIYFYTRHNFRHKIS